MIPLLLILAGGVFLGGCATLAAPEAESPRHPAEPSKQPTPPETELEHATAALDSWEQECRSGFTVCALPDAKKTAKMNRWFQALANTDPTSNPEAWRRALEHAKRFERAGSRSIDDPLKLISATANLAELLDGQRLGGKTLTAAAFQDLLLNLPLSLESHRGEPLLLLSEYVKSRASLLTDPDLASVFRVASALLPVLSGALLCTDDESLESGGRCDEHALRQRLLDAQALLLADHRIDLQERQATLQWITRWQNTMGTEGAMGSLLAVLSQGQIDGDVFRDPFITWSGNHGSAHTFMVNHGRAPTTAQDYRNVDHLSTSPMHRHLITRNCFAAALCLSEQENTCPAEHEPWNEINAHYRPIDLRHEKALPDDLLVYGFPFVHDTSDSFASQRSRSQSLTSLSLALDGGRTALFFPLHASLVASVNAEGIPTRAIGKMGIHGAIQEHDPSLTETSYGPLIAVFRKRT